MDRISPLFNAIDNLLASILPLPLRIVLWGLLSGGLVMALYYVVSPQERIKKKKLEIKGLQREMKAVDESFSELMRLAGKNIRSALGLMGYVLLPTLLSLVPMLLIVLWMDSHFAGMRLFASLPQWMSTWMFTYFVSVTVAALGAKLAFKIE